VNASSRERIRDDSGRAPGEGTGYGSSYDSGDLDDIL
jgi:sec-independent protein translocase protein TatC